MTVFYPVPEVFPDPRARFIQIMNTAVAIAESGLRIKLLVGKDRNLKAEDILGFYGLKRHENLEIVQLPILRKDGPTSLKFSWHGVFNFSLLMHLLTSAKKGDVLLVRHLKLADFLLRFMWRPSVLLVFEAHEIFHLTTKNINKQKKIENIERRVYGRVDGILVLTESLKEEMDRRFGLIGSRFFVIPSGVKEEYLRDRTTASTGEYICYIGSLYPWKGVDVAIRAMKFLPGERLLIVGGGGRLAELKELAVREGVADRVDFVGKVDHKEVKKYLFRAKAALLPNILEGPSISSSPLKLFEYMASRVPVVASELEGLKSVVTHGENAILVEPGSPEALADGIRALISSPELAERIADRAGEDAENFTYRKRGERIVRALKEISSKK